MTSNFLKTHRIRYFLERMRFGAGIVFHSEKEVHQREVEFLDTLIKVMTLVVIAQTVYRLVESSQLIRLVPLLICLPILTIAYLNYRSQHYQWTIATILLAAYLTFTADVVFFGVVGSIDELVYLMIVLLVGVVLLSPRLLFGLIALNIGFVFLTGLWAIPDGFINFLASPLLGIAFASSFALVMNRYLRFNEQDRRVEMSENESIFHGLITNVPVILVVLDNQGVITLVEGKALEEMAFDPNHFVGRSVYEAYAEYPQLLEDCRRALAGEIFNSTLDLFSLAFDVWYSPLRSDDNVITGMIAVATDVTEHRRAEDVLQQQASLLQSVSDAIISLGLNFNIETWNRAAEELYGWLNYEVIGRPVNEVILTEQPVDWANLALEQLKQSGLWECELFQKQKNGVSICVLASFSALEDSDGNIIGIILVGRDITQRKRAEKQSLDLALEREKVKLLKEFIGDSSHDFRTPLATIRTSAYLLRRKHPEITVKHLDVIDNEVDHLGRLVEDLLTLARLDRSPMLEFAPVEINDLIEAVLAPIHLLSADKRQNLLFERGRASFIVSGDLLELERVLVNVLTNAINYTPEAGQITIQTSIAEKSVLIKISDTGMGISDEDIPFIFDRFFRVDKTRGSKTGGAGLGLPIAKKIIEAHHGTISVESRLGFGSTFVIRLPLM